MDEKQVRLFAGFTDIPIEVRVRLGNAPCQLKRLSELAEGEVLLLGHAVGVPFELVSEAVPLAHLEPVADDEKMSFKVLDIIGGNRESDD